MLEWQYSRKCYGLCSLASNGTSLVKVYIAACYFFFFFSWVISFVYKSSFSTVHPRGWFASVVQPCVVFLLRVWLVKENELAFMGRLFAEYEQSKFEEDLNWGVNSGARLNWCLSFIYMRSQCTQSTCWHDLCCVSSSLFRVALSTHPC